MHIVLHMPKGGELGYISAWLVLEPPHVTRYVEFRGRAYSVWDLGENTEMYRLHCMLETVNRCDFQNGVPQTLTPWNKEWSRVYLAVSDALKGVV